MRSEVCYLQKLKFVKEGEVVYFVVHKSQFDDRYNNELTAGNSELLVVDMYGWDVQYIYMIILESLRRVN